MRRVVFSAASCVTWCPACCVSCGVVCDVSAFTEQTERLFSSTTPSQNASIAAKQFQKIINNTSNRTIPTGHRKTCKPGLSPTIRNLTNQRDALRQSNPSDPSIPTLNAQITNETRREANEAWRKELSAASHKSDIKRYWRLMKKTVGKKCESTTQPAHRIWF